MLLFPLRFVVFCLTLIGRRPDICHLNISVYGSTFRKGAMALVCLGLRIPYVLHFHGGPYPAFMKGLPKTAHTVIRYIFAKAERVIVLGEAWRSYVASNLHVAPDRIDVIYNAVSGPASPVDQHATGTCGIAYLGRLEDLKGLDVLVEALRDPQLAQLDWRITLAGEGDRRYESMLRAPELRSRVSFPGWLDADSVAQLLADSKVLVLPSRVENLPLTVLEGMAYGLCVVSTSVGAIPEVITHLVNGILVRPGDVDELRDALCQAIADRDLRARLGSAARKDFLDRFDIRNYSQQLSAVYEKVLRPPSQRQR
jgi:glycosyltransferase involved in cell wall biosynthesis